PWGGNRRTTKSRRSADDPRNGGDRRMGNDPRRNNCRRRDCAPRERDRLRDRAQERLLFRGRYEPRDALFNVKNSSSSPPRRERIFTKIPIPRSDVMSLKISDKAII